MKTSRRAFMAATATGALGATFLERENMVVALLAAHARLLIEMRQWRTVNTAATLTRAHAAANAMSLSLYSSIPIMAIWISSSSKIFLHWV